MLLHHFDSLRARLLTSLAVLFLVLTGMALAMRAAVLDSARQEAAARTMRVAERFASLQQQQVSQTRSLLETLAGLLPAAGPECPRTLRSLLEQHAYLANLLVLDHDGRLECLAVPARRTAPSHFQDLASLRHAAESGGFFLGPLFHAPIGKPILHAVLMASGGTGENTRYFVAAIDLEYLNSQIAQQVPPGFVVRMTDREGVNIVRQPDPQCCFGRPARDLPGIRRAIAAGEPQVNEKVRWLDGIDRLQADIPLREPIGGVLSVGVPAESVEAPANRALAVGVTAMLAIALLATMLVWWGAEAWILQPMQRLAHAVHRMRSGQLVAPAESIGGTVEWRALAKDFNGMAAALDGRQTELATAERRWRTILDGLDGAGVGLLIVDARRRVAHMNRTLVAAFGDQTGKLCSSALGAGEADCAFCRFDEVVEGGRTIRYQFAADGRSYDIIATPLSNADGSVSKLEIIHDITERSRMEEALRRANDELEARVTKRTRELESTNRELEAFAYSVSHDLRAPLRAIDGFVHLLEEDCGAQVGGQGTEYMRRARAAAQRMGHLIDDLLMLSRISRQEMQRGTIDMSALAREVAQELAEGEPERRVAWHIGADLWSDADPVLMRVALANLFGNAWKYTSRRPDAEIEFGLREHKGRPAFYVRDNGAGFDMAYAGKLFGAFQRLHSATEFPGTGVGLATVARVIHRHGGQVWAEAAVGKGATFFFTLQSA